MSDPYVLTFPWKSPPITLNQRLHWARKARLTREVRTAAHLKARHIPSMERCRVGLVWYVNDRRKRDTDNPFPTYKAMCDGLIDADLVDDDSPEYMDKEMIRIVYRPKAEGLACMVLTVTDIGENE